MTSLFQKNLKEHNEVMKQLKQLDPEITLSNTLISNTFKNNGKLFLCGNGGSAADSQHLAAEFTGRFTKDRIPLPAIALTTDTSALTCIGNDYSFDQIFSRQILALGKPNDCLISISTSGNSKNIYNAVVQAKKIGIKTISFLGNDGGSIKLISDINIIVPSNSTARIQEAHILIGHSICGSVELNLNLF